MTKQIIDNLQPGTLDGDSLYIAAEKINANFNEIFTHFGDGSTLDGGYVGLKNLNAGFIVSEGANSYTSRTLRANMGSGITITNGNGAGGDPTIDIQDSGVLPVNSDPVFYPNSGITVDVKGRITRIQDPSLLTNAQSASSTATQQASSATNSAADAQKLAINAEDSQFTLSDGTTTGFSALHYSAKAAADVATIGTSLSDAQTAATTATTQAGIATTQASNASTSASNASTSESNASTSESNASASASTAAGHVATALSHANTASGHATTATNAVNSIGTAVTDAQNAANSATASYDSFDDRYLGAKTSAPTVDNDGNALITGALYFNSTSDKMFVRTSGGSWTAAGSAVNGTTNRSSYTATANQTTFASVYDVGYVDVYLNGLKLMPADFTATDGANIVLASGAAANDTIDIVAYGAFNIADVYTKTESDGRYYLKATADSNFLDSALNLSDIANAATARTNLGLAAVASSGNYSDLSGTPTAASNIAGGAANGILYQSATDTTAHLAAGTSGYILQTNGTGSAPTWVPKSSVASPTGVATVMKLSI